MNTTHCGASGAEAHGVTSLAVELLLISAQAETVAQAIRNLGGAATDEIQAVICQLETAATILRGLEEEQGDDGADTGANPDDESEALTAEERNPSLLRSGRFWVSANNTIHESTMEWITERQPTEADADNDGEVIMLRRADGRGNGATGARDAFVDWRHVGPGVPWKHNRLPSIQGLLDTPVATESKPQPAPEPVASDRPALAVGQTWMDRDGRVVTIEGYDPVTNNAWPF